MNWTYEYIKLIASWPVITLVIFLLVINHFKTEIIALCGRILKISREGLIFSDQIKNQEDLETAIRTLEAEKQERKEEIEKNRFEANKLLDIATKLNSDLKSTQVLLHFEKTYNLIFGGQIKILFNLRSKGGVDNLVNIVTIFNQTVQSNSWLVGYGFTDYLKFLMGSALIEVVDQGSIKITDLGINFLQYIESQNYSIYKMG